MKILDVNDIYGNLYSSFSDEEQEVITYEEEGGDIVAISGEGEINDYCNKFIDFM